MFKDIRELDREYIAEFDGMTPSGKNAWSATFFNTVEYLRFAVNHRLAPTDTLKKFFFAQALPAWRKMFDDHVANGIISDAQDMFIEFKHAEAKIKAE